MISDDSSPPEHDPLAEEMDLITFQEADARLYREQVRTRDLIARLEEAAEPDQEEIAAQQGRLEALGRVQKRLRGSAPNRPYKSDRRQIAEVSGRAPILGSALRPVDGQHHPLIGMRRGVQPDDQR